MTDEELEDEQPEEEGEPSFGKDAEQQPGRRPSLKDAREAYQAIRGEQAEQAGARAATRGAQAAGKTAQAAGRAAVQAARAAGQAAMAAGRAAVAFFSTPVGWIVAGIILLVIIIIALVFIIYSFTKPVGGSAPRYPNLENKVEAADNTDFLILLGDPIGHWEQIKNRANLIKGSLQSARQKATTAGKIEEVKKIDETVKIIDEIIQAAEKQDSDKIKQLKEALGNRLEQLSGFLISSSLPPRDDQVIEKILASKNITGDSTFKSDVRNGFVSSDLLKFILIAGDNNFKLFITATRSDHRQFVHKNGINTNRISAHFYGRAVDIGVINGQIVRPSSNETEKFVRWIVENEQSLKRQNSSRGELGLFPRQIICPRSMSRWAVNSGRPSPGFYFSGHEDHVHVGF